MPPCLGTFFFFGLEAARSGFSAVSEVLKAGDAGLGPLETGTDFLTFLMGSPAITMLFFLTFLEFRPAILP